MVGRSHTYIFTHKICDLIGSPEQSQGKSSERYTSRRPATPRSLHKYMASQATIAAGTIDVSDCVVDTIGGKRRGLAKSGKTETWSRAGMAPAVTTIVWKRVARSAKKVQMRTPLGIGEHAVSEPSRAEHEMKRLQKPERVDPKGRGRRWARVLTTSRRWEGRGQKSPAGKGPIHGSSS